MAMLTALAKKDYFSVADKVKIRYPLFSKPIIALVGGFGSGKTEVSVNLTKYLISSSGTSVTIVDLDLVNPYFRSREAITEMEALGIRVIAPGGGQYYSDLPILLPEVKGAIESNEGILILDVGGDAQGTRALGSMAEIFPSGGYEMLMIINSRRPQTSDVEGCKKTMQRIELSAKLKFTGLVSNSHMIEETDIDVIKEGYRLAQDVSRASDLPLLFVSAKSDILGQIEPDFFDCPLLPMTRSMLKPWERQTGEDENKTGKK